MKKAAVIALLVIIILTAQVSYINYRLEQKLGNIENNQQNILTKVYSIERSTERINHIVRQALHKQQLKQKKQYFFLTNNDLTTRKSELQKAQGIN